MAERKAFLIRIERDVRHAGRRVAAIHRAGVSVVRIDRGVAHARDRVAAVGRTDVAVVGAEAANDRISALHVDARIGVANAG